MTGLGSERKDDSPVDDGRLQRGGHQQVDVQQRGVLGRRAALTSLIWRQGTGSTLKMFKVFRIEGVQS